jgi:putative SOS response-associated peptidase YedK
MCGRYALNRALAQLRAAVGAQAVADHGRNFVPSNNIAPGTHAPVVRRNVIELMHWGASRGSINLINARSETVESKFAGDMNANRRCVVPADGYFEWNSQKQPFFFKHTSSDLVFLAAVFDASQNFVILTMAASEQISSVHERMPIILTLEQIGLWESGHWREALSGKAPMLNFYPVGRAALATGHNGEECIRPISVKKKAQNTLDEMLKSSKRQSNSLL